MIKRVHFIRIGGVAASAFAVALKEKGLNVSGSERLLYEPSKGFLEKNNLAPTKLGYFKENITKDIDIVIAHLDNDEEYLEAKRLGLKIMSWAELLSFFLKDKEVICVSGTYGKTTTTALITWILKYAGLEPGYLIGGHGKNFEDSFSFGKGKYFVIEGDEYQSAYFDKKPKFLYYNPKHLILTSAELDHVNIYPNEENYLNSFRMLLHCMPENSNIFVCKDNKEACELVKEMKNCRYYSLKDANNINYDKGIYFNLNGRRIKTNLLGEHNISNIIGAIKVCKELGINEETIFKAIEEFKGVKKRQEIIFEGLEDEIKIIDDFAHHPIEVRETIRAIKGKYKNSRVWAIYEPHTYSSFDIDFIKRYTGVFDEADISVLYKTAHKKAKLNPTAIEVKDYLKYVPEALYFEDTKEMVKYFAENKNKGDVFLFMSSGSFDGAIEDFVGKFKEIKVENKNQNI